MPRLVTDEEAREAWESVFKIKNRAEAGRRTGISATTLQHRVTVAMERFNLPHPSAEIAHAAFKAAPIPSKERSIEELIKHRVEESRRSREWEDATKLIEIEIRTPGPVGFMVFGDPHIDSPGADFELLKNHVELAKARRDTVFAINVGDYRDNWIGRLGRLYSQTTVSAKEGWKLTEWLIQSMSWVALIRGNHDAWCGDNDPLDWIARGADVGVDMANGVRLALRHPNEAVTRLHVRHDFPGNSLYNPLHALKRETLHGYRDHIIVAGHRHEGADAGDMIGGLAVQMVRVSGYKVSDSFRHEKHFPVRNLHPAALIIVDPDEPDGSRARAWAAPTVEKGIEYLDIMRERYEETYRGRRRRG